jgi:hypothetical protein
MKTLRDRYPEIELDGADEDTVADLDRLGYVCRASSVPAARDAQIRRALLAHVAAQRAMHRWPRCLVELGDLRKAVISVSASAVAAVAAVLAWTLVVSPLLSGQGASAAAARVLRSEARVAARQPAMELQPGEFAYTRSQEANVDGVVLPGGRTYDVLVRTTREIWVGPDGSGRIRQVSEPGGFPTAGDRSLWEAAGSPSLSQFSAPETYDRTFGSGGLASPLTVDGLNRMQLLGMESDPSALASAIHAVAAQNSNPLGFEMLTIIGDLLSESAAPPQLRSSLYQVAATIPDVQLLGAVRDPAGRKGIAIAGDGRLELIFDPATSVLLAKEQTPAQPVAIDGTPVAPRTVTNYTVYLQSGIVSSENATAGGS